MAFLNIQIQPIDIFCLNRCRLEPEMLRSNRNIYIGIDCSQRLQATFTLSSTPRLTIYDAPDVNTTTAPQLRSTNSFGMSVHWAGSCAKPPQDCGEHKLEEWTRSDPRGWLVKSTGGTAVPSRTCQALTNFWPS
ncbi:hypothetical protein PM082_018777 [Marasmius tenuissimus]|nr:hypothetical protein PM082_018777 [Marasmius tenuissimus]